MSKRQPQARSEQDKQARREVLLDAARDLFARANYAEVTMASIAGAAGLAKGTVYLYFATKETLFVTLLLGELAGWLGAIEASLSASEAPVTPERVVAQLTRQIVDRPLLVRLLGLLHVVLEQNIDAEETLAFKRALWALICDAGAVIERALGGLEPGLGARFLLQLYAVVVGLGQMTRATSMLDEVIRREPVLRELQLNFALTLEEMASALLRALVAQRARA